MKRIKKKETKPNKIRVSGEVSIELDYPIFCFRHLQTKTGDDHQFYTAFIERLKKLSNLSWNQIGISDRHSFGTEKMPIDSIKPQLPRFVTPDVTHLTVFRANGDNRPFLGLRRGIVFHILFLEEKFGDVYNH